MTSGKTIFALFNGKMTKMDEAANPLKSNFLIVCDYGDWSGYRTLEQCQAQFGALENSGRSNFFYRVIETGRA